MKKIVLVITAILQSKAVLAEDPVGVSSGLIPYACTSEGAKYLLAYDPDNDRRAWGAFGGGAKENETSTQTAIREFREETNCAYSRTALTFITLKGPSISSGFYSYVAEVPYVDSEAFGDMRKCVDVERSFWVWVPHKALIRAMESSYPEPLVKIQSKPQIKFYLWKGAAKSMRKAKSEGFLGERDPCKS